jgi:hypothetical protein
LRYPRIGHLPGSRTGPRDRTVDDALARRLTVESHPGDVVLVEEKLDGSCVGLTRQAGRLVAIGREGRPAASSRNENRRAFAGWAAPLELPFVAEGETLWGEWLALAHGTRYRLPHGPFVAFDLFVEGQRLPHAQLEARLAGALPRPRLIHQGGALSLGDAERLLGDAGHHGATEPAEGVIYRLEARGRVLAMAKLVRGMKVAGRYLPDHSGGEPIWNHWPGKDS